MSTTHISCVSSLTNIAYCTLTYHAQNFKYLYQKRVLEMLDTSQFLHILAAESDHLVTVSVTLPPEVIAEFERRLYEAFASDSVGDSARAWNEERQLVVKEAIEQHLVPAAVKWTREWLREEVEEFICKQCADVLRDVRSPSLPRRNNAYP